MERNNKRTRTDQDMMKTLDQAKINPETVCNFTQVLQFSPITENFKCLELNKQLLEAVEKGESLVIRGRKNDSAVICSGTLTFDLKEAETSNSLLILPEISFPKDPEVLQQTEKLVKFREVKQLVSTYLEPRPCKPRFNSLRKLLSQNQYKGPECEEEAACVTTTQLLNEVQASEAELHQELDSLLAIQINGSWRLLSFNYQYRVLSMFLRYFEDMSIPLDKIPLTQSCVELQDTVPLDISEKIFLWYTQPSPQLNGETLYKLHEDRVCRTLAEAVLRPAHKFLLDEFLTIWQQSVPEGLQINIRQLCGVAVVDKGANPPCISYFPEHELPENVHERLHKLFQQCQAWPLDEIVPYMEQLATPDMPVKALLAKYSRMSTKGGVKYITGKHTK